MVRQLAETDKVKTWDDLRLASGPWGDLRFGKRPIFASRQVHIRTHFCCTSCPTLACRALGCVFSSVFGHIFSNFRVMRIACAFFRQQTFHDRSDGYWSVLEQCEHRTKYLHVTKLCKSLANASRRDATRHIVFQTVFVLDAAWP